MNEDGVVFLKNILDFKLLEVSPVRLHPLTGSQEVGCHNYFWEESVKYYQSSEQWLTVYSSQ